MYDSTERELFEHKRLQSKNRMTVLIVLMVVCGVSAIAYMVMYSPVADRKPIMDADACTKMCSDVGVESYTDSECKCNPPKKPGLVQVDRMDCNCACRPYSFRQDNSLKPGDFKDQEVEEGSN